MSYNFCNLESGRKHNIKVHVNKDSVDVKLSMIYGDHFILILGKELKTMVYSLKSGTHFIEKEIDSTNHLISHNAFQLPNVELYNTCLDYKIDLEGGGNLY